MTRTLSRRDWFARIGITSGAAALAVGRSTTGSRPQPTSAPADGTILRLTSTSDVFVPPRGRGFQKFSFDFPEPSVAFDRLSVGFRLFTHENVYAPDPSRLVARGSQNRLEISADRLVCAGGQEIAAGRIAATLSKDGPAITCAARFTSEKPVKAAGIVVRGVPRGRISAGGADFVDPRDNEILLGYPFSGGDLFGPVGNGGLPTPLVLVQPQGGEIVAISSLDDHVRTKRFYFQPGAHGYRVEALVETPGWTETRSFEMPTWRIGRASTIGEAVEPHFNHIERAFRIPRFRDRSDVPDWLRRTALVVTLHGMHYTGYVFNNYDRMLTILRWMATRLPADQVLVFLASWDGRYYWDYPLYRPADRMGGDAGFKVLIKEAQALGFRMMPMFGANAANRRQDVFAQFGDAATSKIDGDRFDLNWVDWDNDRHQEGWLSYMNLGVESWRRWLTERIAETIDRYGVDAYFLDIAGGWVNNPRADMHEGLCRLVADLRGRYPHVLACGEMHYDALMTCLPLYHSFGQTLVADFVQRHARFFQHLSHPAPGRGSSGVHESGFSRWNPATLSLTEWTIPTLNVVDDTFDQYRSEMEAVIAKARERARL